MTIQSQLKIEDRLFDFLDEKISCILFLKLDDRRVIFYRQ